MLTRELIRAKVEGDRLLPFWLRPTPALLELAEDLLAHWRAGIDARRGELEDAAVPILHRSRSLPLAKGLLKLIVDDCEFREPEGAEELRSAAFDAGARALAAPVASAAGHAEAIAAGLGLTAEALSERLYADLPDLARLVSVPAWTADQLIARYNVALAQGCLLGAARIQVEVADRDLGRRRLLLKALRFQRLLVEVGGAPGDDADLTISIAGPASVLDQGTRYGLQIAQFLPALCCLRSWRAVAEIVPRQAAPGAPTLRLELDSGLGLTGESRYLAFVPEEFQVWRRHLAAKQPDWTIRDGDPVAALGGELVIPDLRISAARGEVQIELFHRWHAQALRSRLEQVEALPGPPLLLCVDRVIVRGNPDLALHRLWPTRVVGFSDLPAVGPLSEAVNRFMNPR